MELRDGYKQTEVGVIPDDWEVSTYGEVFTELRGGAPFKPSDFTRMGVKVLPKGGVARGGILQIDESDLQYCTENYAANHKTNTVDKSHTIVVLRDLVPSGPSIGLMVRIEADESFILAQGVYGFKTNPVKACPHYLIQLSNGTPYRRLMNSIMVGSTQVHVTNTALKLAPLPRPPVSEQRAIATALSDVDALISGLDQLIAKKRDIKQAAMQQLLTGQTRLPGFGGEWAVKRLGDVLDKIVGGGTPSRSNPNYWGNEIPWVTVKDFATFNPRQSQEAITQEGLKHSASNLIPKGTLITSTRMALGKAVIYEVDVSINQDLKALFPKRNIDSEFLYHWFEYHASAIDDLGSGSTVKGISLADLKAIEFHLATLDEQTAIATMLSDMDAEIAAIEARRDKTRDLKQGMMQELLTGRIRLI